MADRTTRQPHSAGGKLAARLLNREGRSRIDASALRAAHAAGFRGGSLVARSRCRYLPADAANVSSKKLCIITCPRFADFSL